MKVLLGTFGLLSGFYLGYYLRENTNIRPSIISFMKSLRNKESEEEKKYKHIPLQYKINKVVEKYSGDPIEYNRVVSAVEKRRVNLIDKEFDKIMESENKSNPFKEILEGNQYKSH